jgi:hypothetical protein
MTDPLKQENENGSLTTTTEEQTEDHEGASELRVIIRKLDRPVRPRGVLAE